MNKYKQILKKYKQIFVVVAVFSGIIITVFVWNLWYNQDMPYKSLKFDSENVNCIVAVQKTQGYPSRTITDKNQISQIIDYFNELKIRELNPREELGISDAIKSGILNCKGNYIGQDIRYFTLTFYSDEEGTEQNKLHDIYVGTGERICVDGKDYAVQSSALFVYRDMSDIFNNKN